MRRVKSKKIVADLGTKALSKATISKHSITVVDVNMDEERVEDAQQDVAAFWYYGSGPDVRDEWQDRQLAEYSRCPCQATAAAALRDVSFETFAEIVKRNDYHITGRRVIILVVHQPKEFNAAEIVDHRQWLLAMTKRRNKEEMKAKFESLTMLLREVLSDIVEANKVDVA